MKTFNEEDLLFIKIPGLKLKPFLESLMCEDASDLTTEKGISKLLMSWKDKEKSEKLFFENMSLKGYGKLSELDVQEKICEDMGVMALIQIYILAWVHYLGNQLTASVDPEKLKTMADTQTKTE